MSMGIAAVGLVALAGYGFYRYMRDEPEENPAGQAPEELIMLRDISTEESGASEASTSEVDVSGSGASEVSTSEVDVSESGASEVSTSGADVNGSGANQGVGNETSYVGRGIWV